MHLVDNVEAAASRQMEIIPIFLFDYRLPNAALRMNSKRMSLINRLIEPKFSARSSRNVKAAERIGLTRMDITKLAVDAIVNAANTSLLGGGGVDGAIHRAAGPALLVECLTLGGCPTGQARITKGYRLPAKFVIHTPGPVWRGGKSGEPELLASCYRACFDLARTNAIKTIAFPAISCGIYGYPIPDAARIALRETRDALKDNVVLERVVFACFAEEVFQAYKNTLEL
jgi:O-acetyl-ADP-ribose deacetylase